VRAFGWSPMRITLFHRPAADLCAVELEGVQVGRLRRQRSCRGKVGNKPGASGAGW
jgi:hypothetical protein